jgi:large subunit ribosomal protein L9
MKVVLVKDVQHLGEAGSIQTVKDGYARNFLIPQGFAMEATPGRIKEAEQRIQAAQRRIAKEEQAQQSLADRLEGTRLHIVARVGEQGRLYGSITASDVAERLSAELGEEIDRRKVLLDEPIRSIGEHHVTVHLVGRLRPTVTVVVTSEEGDAGAFGEVDTSPASEGVASSAESGTAAQVIDEMRGVEQ